MVIIRFPNGTDWYKANWVFRQLAKDVAELPAQDVAVNLAMDAAGAFGALYIDEMDPELAAKTLDLLRRAAAGALNGSIGAWSETNPEDSEGHRMYLRSMSELLDTIGRQKPAGG